ncbi:prevent-host-death protein [Pseudomonas sp. P1.31]|uniref:prevent-host-death protein n=1 Tax=Pseudomonas sp. P1.31 TaxID=1699311 RepID=UPI00069E3B1B|nr:prevent-host-death protein [Pseudomonas sp. P1.31]
MQTTNSCTTRHYLTETMDCDCEDYASMLLAQQRGGSVVTLSLTEIDALDATIYLLRSPANAERLIQSIDEMRTGKTEAKRLIKD